MENQELCLRTGDWLLPAEGQSCWACVACDQFTSQPEYWAKARAFVGESPSTLKLILPECELKEAPERVPEIQKEMERYLLEGLLSPVEGFILTERTTESGTRTGLVVLMDLEGYDYRPGAKSLIRPTEGTIVDRIPPRLMVRRGAALELSHVMMLIDDPTDTVLAAVKEKKARLPKVYDFSLMMDGGQLAGYQVSAPADIEAIFQALLALKERLCSQTPLLYAVGDGNHSLATAKANWEEKKAGLSPEAQKEHPARFAMVELLNIHDAALRFEPIHRVLFHVEPEKVMADMAAYGKSHGMTLQGEDIGWVTRENGRFAFQNAPQTLPVGALQAFLDDWLQTHTGAQLDYIHGEDTVRALTQAPNTLGFLLPTPDKSGLFAAVSREGVLPRKTFSMGEANEKRYYMEARRI